MSIIEVALMIQLSVVLGADPLTSTVVKVNGSAVTAGDVEFAAIQNGVTPESRATEEPKLIEKLIDRQLIRGFLASRKIEPVADELNFQIATAEEAIRKSGEDPKKLLAKLGMTPQRLKSELGLSLAWQVYLRKTTKPEQVKDYFEQHRQELDGTQLRANHIFLKLPNPASETETTTKRERMSEIRNEIVAGKLTFSDAAKAYSEAPTKDRGGDIGFFGPKGKLPPTVSKTAFQLKVDEISEPIVSPLGIHLIQITEKHPGEFSLEDVRPVIVDRLSQQFWNEIVQKERTMAKIEWVKK